MEGNGKNEDEEGPSSQRFRAKVELLKVKDLQRREKNEQRRLQAESTSEPGESATEFWHKFNVEKIEIRGGILNASEARDSSALASIGGRISVLEESLSNSTYFLPQYDVRAFQSAISSLKSELSSLKDALQPKKKFSFARKNISQEVTEKAAESNLAPKKLTAINELDFDVLGKQNSFVISCQENKVIKVEGEQIQSNDVKLEGLKKCKIYLNGCMEALFIHQVSDCKIFCGVVLGATHIEDMTNSVVCVATHQIRIHSTRNSDFYLRVRSRPIVEYTQAVRFAPYNFKYRNLTQDLELAELQEENGLWEKVDDFRWLRSSQSPNWSVLDISDRILDEEFETQ